MNNTNKRISITDRIKAKAANAISNSLIKQAEMGDKRSITIFISEPKFPIELMKKDIE